MRHGRTEILPPKSARGDAPRADGAQAPSCAVRLRLGDVAALEELVEAYWDGCILYARSLLGQRDERVLAEDLVQEAFTLLWEHRGRLEADTALQPYLLRMVRNLALNETRRLKVRSKWTERVRESLGRLNPTPAHVLAAKDLEARAREAVNALPERRREVFLLVRVQGLTYDEVARTMGISRQTVANQMSAALEALRIALDVDRIDRGP